MLRAMISVQANYSGSYPDMRVQLLPSPANARYIPISYTAGLHGWSNMSEGLLKEAALSGNRIWTSRIAQADPKPPGCCCRCMPV